MGSRLPVLLAVALVACGLSAGSAVASTLTPCPKPPPAPAFQGEGTLTTSGELTRNLRSGGVRQKLIAPANSLTGRPTFPLKAAYIKKSPANIWLGGGMNFMAAEGRRVVSVNSMRLTVRPGKDPVVSARVAGRTMRLFTVRGGRVTVDRQEEVLNLRGGLATVSGAAALRINSLLRLRGSASIAGGDRWGFLTVFAARNLKIDDPVAETPVEPPFLNRPVGAVDISSATVEWRVRESFIRYVAVGAGTSVADGATAGQPEALGGAAPLVYSFGFPFTNGWVAPDSGPAAIHGSGKVGFRHCRNTINFTVADPEIELNGDSDSRLIFRVDGTDGTAFPDSRAVMVELIPSLATKSTEGNTTTLSDIPGYIPQAATGIFADFYPPFPGSVDAPGADLSRFGSLTVSYTTG